MKNILKYLIIFYNVIALLLALIWFHWKMIWYDFMSFLAPQITVYIVPLLLLASLVLLFTRVNKNIGLALSLLPLISFEYILYHQNFIYIESCHAGWLWPIFDPDIHFWVNSAMLLIVLGSITINVLSDRKILREA